MEFNEKLQELRKQKNLTQEELAEHLYVSRTAISKWESGRGYPSIESLKVISEYFSVSIDELLSGEEILCLAEAVNRQKEKSFCGLVFALLDISVIMFLFLPFFGQKTNEGIQAVSLLSLYTVSTYLKILYYVTVIGIIIYGLLTLVFQNYQGPWWVKNREMISIVLSGIAVLLFIISSQTYGATFLFVFFLIKVLMLKNT